MRRLLLMICCLVLATTLVARGAGMSSCPDGASCCASMPEPVKPAEHSCCATDQTPKPASHPMHSAAMADMPCCASIVWTPSPGAMPVAGDVIARRDVAPADEPRSAAAAEPATPPPRSIA